MDQLTGLTAGSIFTWIAVFGTSLVLTVLSIAQAVNTYIQWCRDRKEAKTWLQ